MLPHAEECETILGRKWRLKYNRIYNRRFDSSKMDSLSGGRMSYTPIETGLARCVDEFFRDGCKYSSLHILNEAYMDRRTHVSTKLSEFHGFEKKVKYLIARYTPYMEYRKFTNR